MAEIVMDDEKRPRKRAPTFSKAEEALLLEEYERRRGFLECSKGTNSALAAKRRAWEEIAASLNSFNINAVRSWEDIRRKFKNILQSGKKKTDSNTGTGGGSTQVLTETEEKAISLNDGQDTLVGLQSGIDSASSFDDFHPVTIMDLGFKILENETITTEMFNVHVPAPTATKKPAAETITTEIFNVHVPAPTATKKPAAETITTEMFNVHVPAPTATKKPAAETITTEMFNVHVPAPTATKKPAAETKGVDAWQEYLQTKIDSKKVLLPLQTKFYQSAASYFDSQTELAKLKIKLAKKRFEEE